MKYSIVIPHLSNSKCIDTCLKYIKQNSIYEHEIITIVNEYDVYYAFNKGVYTSSCDTVVLLNDDMIVAKNWDRYILIYSNQSTVLTGYVVEPIPNLNCINYDCGDSPTNFNYDMFQQYVDSQQIMDFAIDKKGWYMPLVINKRAFVSYPNINKFPSHANDILLIDHIMPFVGFKFAQIDMWVYHFSRQATIASKATVKKCIFTYYNNHIDSKIAILQNNVIDKLNTIINCKYELLRYNESNIQPSHAIDYAFNKLFYEDQYDIILMLDIDCIPLNTKSIEYMFDQASRGILVGNIQRSNHIDNNEHVFVAPSAICISKSTFELLGKPSFNPTYRSDVGEELTFIAEKINVPLEMFLPDHYQELPLEDNHLPWNLKTGMPQYGIGTTFVNSNGDEMFYHLFQSRFHKFNQLFFNKCADILINESTKRTVL